MQITCEDCQSHQNGLVCKDGFVQGNYPHYRVPSCMREDLPAHLINDDGSPVFYRALATSGEE